MHAVQQIADDFLKGISGKSVMLYFSSCKFRKELLELPFDYIILNSNGINDRYHKPGLTQLIAGKVITLTYDNERTLRLLINAGVKISCVVGIQDGCEEGGNHECVNSYNFFSRLSAVVPDEFLYITNHYFVKGNPLKRSVPYNFLRQKPEILGFDPLLLTEYCRNPESIFIFKVKKTAPDTISYKVGQVNILVHHLSIWDMAAQLDGLIIPEYPAMVRNNFLDQSIMLKSLPHHQGIEHMLTWASRNKFETIGSIPLAGEQVMAETVLDKIENWKGSFPKTIHFCHLLKSDLAGLRNVMIWKHTMKSISIPDREQRFRQLSADILEGKGNPMAIVENITGFGARAFDPLVSGLTSPSVEMRICVINSIVKISRKKALNVMISILGNIELQYHWRDVVRLIAEGSVRIDWKIIYAALHDPDPVIRKNIICLLHHIDNIDSLHELISMLDDPDDNVFFEVCSLIRNYSLELSEIRSPQPELIRILQSPVPIRRLGAAKALAGVGNLEAVGPLYELIEQFPFDRSLHQEIAIALAEIYDEYENEDLRILIDGLLENNKYLGNIELKRRLGLIREEDEDFYQ